MINEEKKVEGPMVQLSTVKAEAVNEIERTKSQGRYGQAAEWGSEFEARVSVKVANQVQEIRLRWEKDYSQQGDVRRVVIKGDEGLEENASAFGILIDWSDIFNAYLILVNKWFDADEAARKDARGKAWDASWVQTMLPAFQAVKIEGVSVAITLTREEFVAAKEQYYGGLGIKVTYGNGYMLITKDNKGLKTDVDCQCYRASKPETFLKKLKEVVDEKAREDQWVKEAKAHKVTKFSNLKDRFAGYEVKETYASGFTIKLPGQYNFLHFNYYEPDKGTKPEQAYFTIEHVDAGLTFEEFKSILDIAVLAASRKAK